MKTTTVSIVIATYGRPVMLRESVLSFLGMTIPASVTLELLVIDNDPDRSAGDVMDELSERCGSLFELRYIPEPRTGLSYARNRGLEEAQGEIVAFLDDDIFISAGWLVAMLDCLERTGAAAVGGRIETCWEGEPDPAVRACERKLLAHDRGERDLPLRGRRTPGGGNSAFRRNVFADGLRFSTELGRVGKVLLSGEDTELFLRLRQQGQAVWYCAGGLMRHRVGGERLTPDYLVRRNFWFGCSYAIIDRRLGGRFRAWLNAVARLGKLLLVDVPRLALASLRGDAAGKLLARCSLAKQAGYLRATLLPLAIENPVANPSSESGDGRIIDQPTTVAQ